MRPAERALLDSLTSPPPPPDALPATVLSRLHAALSSPEPCPPCVLDALSRLPAPSIPERHIAPLAKSLLAQLRHPHTPAGIRAIARTLTLLSSRNAAAAHALHALHAYERLSRHATPAINPLLARLRAFTRPPRGRKRPLRILSIDGGGTRAVLSLELLTLLATRLGPLAACFDYVIGTSSGGVIALAVGVLGLPPRDVQARYKRLSKTLFRKRARGLIGRGLYDGAIVTQFAREVCADERMCFVGDALHVGVVSAVPGGVLPYLHTNYRSFGRYEWSGCHKLVDVIRATTAAPVLFEVYETETGERFVDGGVVCNNPTAVGVHECMTLYPGTDIGCVVSVGSGRMELFGGGLVKALLWRMTDTEILHHVLEDVLSRYYRLNCDINHTGLDVSGGVLEELIVLARRWGEGEGRVLLDELCSYLESLRNYRHNPTISRL